MNAFAGLSGMESAVDEVLRGTKRESTTRAGERAAGPETGKEKAAPEERGGKMSFIGKRADGIEVYETSKDVLGLTWVQRQARFLEIMKNDSRGRAAKFIRNKHAYYATFEEGDVRKNIYGDKKSDRKGWRAKINSEADGDIFTLVENAAYDGSSPERGKKTYAHNGVVYWDYFVKKVQINGVVFDLLANVRKKANGEFVYSLQLNEDKTKKAVPPTAVAQGAALRSGGPASISSIPNSAEKSNFKSADGRNR
jgi:hypothetical protein